MASTTQTNNNTNATKPDTTAPFVFSAFWLVGGIILYFSVKPIWFWLYVVLVAALVVAGIFFRSFRSGMSPWIVQVVPLWGIVARLDQVSTCEKLRKARIYVDDDPTKTIPATTRKEHKDTFVRFNGGGEPDMDPNHLRDLLSKNARVWRCKSFAISEDKDRPGVFTIQLSPAKTVHTELDDPVIGVVQ